MPLKRIQWNRVAFQKLHQAFSYRLARTRRSASTEPWRMLQVMWAPFSFSAIPLHGPCLATAFTACSPECGIVRTLAASPVLAVWTTKELHRFSHLEKFLVVGKPRVASAWNELEPIAVEKHCACSVPKPPKGTNRREHTPVSKGHGLR